MIRGRLVLRGYMWITRKYMKEKSSCLGALCSVFNRLKSGFSRVDFGPLFIHDSWPPIAWGWILPPDSGYFKLFPGVSRGFHLSYKSPL